MLTLIGCLPPARFSFANALTFTPLFNKTLVIFAVVLDDAFNARIEVRIDYLINHFVG
jgi:hypothetical protein